MVTHLSDDATRMRASSALPIARNTALLSASLAAHSAMSNWRPRWPRSP